MADRSTNLRKFFAKYVAGVGGARDPRIEEAFAAVRREPFVGPGPWSIHVAGVGYVETPSDDVAFVYQDTLVALDAARGINIGMPSAHARWLDALGARPGETVLQVGAGSGYYTAILARLVGAGGRVHAFEIDPTLAAKAAENLKEFARAEVRARSGFADDLPEADAIYVCAGVTGPSRAWLDALRPGGRLVFPLHAVGGFGGMLRIERPERGSIWPARFVSRAGFIACAAPQDDEAGRRLSAAFARGGWETVRSFRLEGPVDDTCWFAGDGWWLSTAPAAPEAANFPRASRPKAGA